MSNGIYAHFHIAPGKRTPSDIFSKMVAAVSSWEEADNEWKSLKVFDGALDTCVVERYGALTSGEVLAATRQCRSQTLSIWSDLSFRCWHTAAGRPFQGFEGSTIIARGDEWLGRHGADRRLRGNAELSVWERAPFSILDVKEFGPEADAWNRHVEENLEILTAGIFRAIESLKPTSVKVYDGFGEYLPVNANLAYYRNEAEVLADLRFMAEFWERGDGTGQVPPLKFGYNRKHRSLLGALRNEAARERLWRSLTAGLANIGNVTERNVRDVLDSGQFDYYAMPVGFTVLDHPGFMNSYLHDFYLAVLKAPVE
ncbi:MAG TPA: hypothetical protein VHI13_20185 [Candidatus Kapabacteria bacterium]|nr:hypothetical protein [Candidatus Kapabacteria bacterium]